MFKNKRKKVRSVYNELLYAQLFGYIANRRVWGNPEFRDKATENKGTRKS